MISRAASDFVRVLKLAPAAFLGSALLSWGVAITPAVLVALTAQIVSDAVGVVNGTVGSGDRAMGAFLQIVAVTLSARVLTGVARYLQTQAALRVNVALAEQVMGKGTRMTLSSYENPDHYNVLRRATSEIQAGRATQLVTGVVGIISSLVAVISIVVVLASWNIYAALLALISPIPAAWASMLMNKKRWAIDFGRAEEQRTGAYLQWLSTNDQTFKEVSHYRLGPTLVNRYGDILRAFLVIDRRFAARSEGFVGVLDLCGSLGAIAALGLAVWSSIGARDVGQLAGFVQAIGTLQGTTTALLLAIASLYQIALYARNLFGFLDIPEAKPRVGGDPLQKPLVSGIEFRDVYFRYPGTDNDVLGPLNFSVPTGTSVAIVGANGAGKSTIVKLLCDLYEPTGGKILIDGRSLQEYSHEEICRNVGVVFQDFAKFELSAVDNIRFGAIEQPIDEERVDVSVSRAGLRARIGRLSSGLNTVLGRRFRGAEQLSIGEWQRFAIARAIYSDTPVRILDEPSASLDPVSEQDLVERVLAAGAGATTIVVAHRFATIRACDRIVLVDEGVVAEQGTHDELMHADGKYAEIYRMQARHFADDYVAPGGDEEGRTS